MVISRFTWCFVLNPSHKISLSVDWSPHKLFLTSYSYYLHLTIFLEWRPTKVEKSLCDRLKNLNYRTQTTSFTQCIKSPDYLYWNHRHIVITLQKDIDWKLSDRCITTTLRKVFIIHTIFMSHWSGQSIVVEPNSRITYCLGRSKVFH